MALPEILPLLTTDRVMWEVATVLVDGAERYDWRPVRTLGQGLTAIASPLDHVQIRELHKIEDAADQIEHLISKAQIEVFYRGKAIGGAERIPFAHRASLSAKVFGMSSVGADPFADPPAGSQP